MKNGGLAAAVQDAIRAWPYFLDSSFSSASAP
jgi:hypothetical protein